MRIVIVDDDVWMRIARETGLAGFGDIEVVGCLDPVMAREFDWDDIDIALVDAHDSSQDWDRYPGVGVVEAIRSRRTPAQTTIIVISARIFDPMLRLRMAEAGADYFYPHLDVPKPDDLAALLRNPDHSRRADPPDNRTLSSLGLRVWSKPNVALRWVSETSAEGYFTEAGTQKTAKTPRRALTRARDQVALLAHLDPSLGDPQRRPGDVSWRDVARFVNRALGRHE